MSGLILPGRQQQQPTELGFQITPIGDNFILVIQCPPSQFVPMPPGPLEQIEGFCGAILKACEQSRKQKALVQEVAQGNGLPVGPRMAE